MKQSKKIKEQETKHSFLFFNIALEGCIMYVQVAG